MSAPQTNVEKQADRHRPSLVGIAAAVIFALVLLFGLITFLAGRGETPEGAETQIDSRTGEEVPADG